MSHRRTRSNGGSHGTLCAQRAFQQNGTPVVAWARAATPIRRQKVEEPTDRPKVGVTAFWRKKERCYFLKNEAGELLKTKDRSSKNRQNEAENDSLCAGSGYRKRLKIKGRVLHSEKRSGNEAETNRSGLDVP